MKTVSRCNYIAEVWAAGGSAAVRNGGLSLELGSASPQLAERRHLPSGAPETQFVLFSNFEVRFPVLHAKQPTSADSCVCG